MARLTQEDLERFVASIATVPAGLSAARAHRPAAQEEVVRYRASIAEAVSSGRLEEAIARELTAYLNRPIQIKIRAERPISGVGPVWRFESEAGGLVWRIELDEELGLRFADAMLEGSAGAASSRAPLRFHSPKLARLVEPVAAHMIASLAAAAGAPTPSALAFASADGPPAGESLLAGMCSVAGQSLSWSATLGGAPGVDADPAADAQTIEPQARALRRSPEDALKAALAAAAARIEELAGRPIALDRADIGEVVAPALPTGWLRLGLSSSGEGALVVSADRESVIALVSASLGEPLPYAADTGFVVESAGETILRNAIAAFTATLLGRSADPPRVVRLASSALPSRSRHYAVTVRGAVDGNAVTLHWLIPAWMVRTE